jgi:hypothetical protein
VLGSISAHLGFVTGVGMALCSQVFLSVLCTFNEFKETITWMHSLLCIDLPPSSKHF